MKKAAVLNAVTLLLHLCSFSAGHVYRGRLGYLCIRPDFVELHPEVSSPSVCSLLCTLNDICQAFTTNDGWCQLFVFNKCSKSVRDCSCSRTGQVFVKQQPGLEPGALCPSGFGDDLCGVKYKMVARNSSYNWDFYRRTCESESGLVIMADVTDASELTYLKTLYYKYLVTFFLGGFQPADSPEPSGGYYWVGCNVTMDAGLWVAPEPNNYGGIQNAVVMWSNAMLGDASSVSNFNGGLCECVSPFD